MFLFKNKWSRRVIAFCMTLTLTVGSGYRLHAQNKVIGASKLSPKIIDAVQNRYGYFPAKWRRWPGSAPARPKRKPERRPENIPPPIDDPRPKPNDETQPTPLPFPLDDLGDNGPDNNGLDGPGKVDDVGPQKLPNPQPFPEDNNSLPSDEVFPLNLRPDSAPVPPDALKQPDALLPPLDPRQGDFSRPLDAPKQDLLPNDAAESLLPNGGAAAAPPNRDEQARRFPPSRKTGRESGRETYRRDSQNRYINPLRSGTRTAVTSPPTQAVPAAAWSARGHREPRQAEPIRTSVTPRFNPLRQ